MADWQSYPMNSTVHWPEDEKIIGVLGLAPLATVDFYQKLCAVQATKDWQYPRVIIDSNPKIPSRGRHLELGETDPVPFIRQSIANLAAQGADMVAIPCNTAHIFYDAYSIDSPVELPHIIHLTVQECMSRKAEKVLVLASSMTIKHELYQNALGKQGLIPLVPDSAGQALVSDCIELVKQNASFKLAGEQLLALVRKSGADAVVLGCTELPVIFATLQLDMWMIDSNAALAQYCLQQTIGSYSQIHTKPGA